MAGGSFQIKEIVLLLPQPIKMLYWIRLEDYCRPVVVSAHMAVVPVSHVKGHLRTFRQDLTAVFEINHSAVCVYFRGNLAVFDHCFVVKQFDLA